ncbi:DUF6193 family natural product biosynthesis protein [Streptomyces sp. NPDC086787]|uniref:DUF6193 family natural product biosynthesis protein n=1 Tax=Streptomyces sp. NPDC086787 TaxID=3365759 RepID=UPI00380FCCB0
MAEAPDAATAWQWLLERRPGTRGCYGDEVELALAVAAHAQPRLRVLYPFPSHGAIGFLRGMPGDEQSREMPYLGCWGPPFEVRDMRHGTLGTAATPEEAAALVVAHLPANA